MTPQQAVEDHKEAMQKEAQAWRNWQLAECTAKEMEASVLLDCPDVDPDDETGKPKKYTVQEKEAIVTVDSRVSAKRKNAINAHYDYLDAKANAQACYEIFLVTHAESKLPVMVNPDQYNPHI